jgi:ribosomal protein S6
MQEEEKDLKNEEIEAETREPKVYELGYLLVPTITVEDVPIMYGNLKELVSSMGGEIISDEMPKSIPLAYTMLKVVKNVRSKFDTAYFGWVKFSMSASAIVSLKKKLDLDSNVIRFLILKTVKENTIAAKRFVGRDMVRRKPATSVKTDESGAPVEINKEEIDKEIDAMVAV